MGSFTLRDRDSILGFFNLGFSRLVVTGLSFLTSVLIARALGVEQLGVFALITGAFAYISIISEFGLRSGIIAESSRRGDVRYLFHVYIRLRLLICLASLLVVVAVTLAFYRPYWLPIVCVMASIFFFALQLDWVFLVTRRYQIAAGLGMVRSVVYFTLTGVAIASVGLDLVLLGLIFLLSWIVAALVSWVATVGTTGSISCARPEDASQSKALLAAGAPVLGATLVSQALQNADLLWVGSMIGAAQAGYYYLSLSIVGACLIFSNAMGQVAIAKYARLKNDPGEIADSLKFDLSIMLAVSLAVSGAIYFAAPAVSFLFGDTYIAVVQLVRHFIPYIVLYYAWSLYFCIFIAVGVQKTLFYVNVLTVLLMPPLLLLATHFGGLHELALVKSLLLLCGIVFMHRHRPACLKDVGERAFVPTILAAVSLALLVWVTG